MRARLPAPLAALLGRVRYDARTATAVFFERAPAATHSAHLTVTRSREEAICVPLDDTAVPPLRRAPPPRDAAAEEVEEETMTTDALLARAFRDDGDDDDGDDDADGPAARAAPRARSQLLRSCEATQP